MVSSIRATRTKAQYHETVSAMAFELNISCLVPGLIKGITYTKREREREMDMEEKC
ncbi:hypothetical protein Lalb_Chr04g0256611 [Lupinus albus]|uniref:Uncharacterized protein n=1 Tax=Lupinus albus TaxID=3870 RepID=A0A6A4QNF2_LUPAL|nr:hypothetical protein Lalb_Chr04g0256611 [Lupinus albus]